MRAVLYGTAALAIAMVSSPDTLRSALATSASALFEATPWALAGAVLTQLMRGRCDAVAYLGCGCASGPTARSLPAAAATWILFGPLVALLRFVAAVGVAHVQSRHADRCQPEAYESAHLLGQLAAILPAALLAGSAIALSTYIDPARLSPVAQIFIGALLGFTSAPCGLGAVPVAGALHVRAPLAAAAFLCIAGIVDLRALRVRPARRELDHDPFAYILLAVALAVVAQRRGDALVHPAIALALAVCAIAALVYAVLHRERVSSPARIAPALMLIGALVGAPPPQYRATETTLADLFPGEHLSFTGALTRDGHACALVRYAITCCRADAAPVVVRLDRSLSYPGGTWLRVDGPIESRSGDLRLVAKRVERIAPPLDPFIYR